MSLLSNLTEWAEQRGLVVSEVFKARTRAATAEEKRRANAYRQGRDEHGRFIVDQHEVACLCTRCMGA